MAGMQSAKSSYEQLALAMENIDSHGNVIAPVDGVLASLTASEGGMGSEDFASYTYELPCAYLLLGAGTAQEDARYGKPMHNESVVFNENILPRGSALLAYGAMQWLEDRQ